MDTHEILKQLQEGDISLEEAEHFLRRQPFDELGYAKLDMHRKIRSGCAEVVYCSGKEDAQLLSIFSHLYEADGEVLGTRASEHQYEVIREHFPEVTYDPQSKILKMEHEDKQQVGCIAVCTAGTADIPVAEQAGILMAIHPDDPPWSIFGLPRIITDKTAVEKLLAMVPSK